MRWVQAICLAGVLWVAADPAAGEPGAASRYWELGWGLYGGEGLDAARFDWHMICFGNVGANEKTVEALNEILRLNPQHKFLIRVWPIMGAGDCEQNRHQATLFHYWYKPGVREKVLAETRRQVRLVCQGVSRPENVYGSCFLEELPGHFSSAPFGGKWKPGDDLPWDMKRFRKEIEAELGEPLNWASREHRLWWGRKYCQALEEIHRAMKEASGGRPVFYYQATAWYTLDHLDLPIFKDQDPYLRIVPISYAEIVKPGVCDGIFGYPNTPTIWKNQTQTVVQQRRCLLFSQMSMPPGMRGCRFGQMVEMARWEQPGNVGSFLYATHGRKTRARNELEYQDESSFWTLPDHVRHFAWEQKIGQAIVDRALAPAVRLVYDLSKSPKKDSIRVIAQVTNRRDASWYGRSEEQATLRNLAISLTVPEGFTILPSPSTPPTIKLGDLGPQRTCVADWWVHVGPLPARIPDGGAFGAELTYAEGPSVSVRCSEPAATIAGFEPRPIARSGDGWAEPLYDRPAMESVVELVPTAEVFGPELGNATRTARYRDTLGPGLRLVIGPGLKARLFALPPFDLSQRQFGAGPEGPPPATAGYVVQRTKTVPVAPGQKYRITITGWARDGGQSMVQAHFVWKGPKRRQQETRDVTCLVKQFGSEEASVSQEIEVPADAGQDAKMQLLFYRFQSKGAVFYKGFDCRRADIAEEGVDVTGRLEGELPRLEPPFTEWRYRDLSDPDAYGRPKLTVRFLTPEEVR